MSARLISASWLLVLASLLNFACCSASYDVPDYVAKHGMSTLPSERNMLGKSDDSLK
jgi:hypothetical protein